MAPPEDHSSEDLRKDDEVRIGKSFRGGSGPALLEAIRQWFFGGGLPTPPPGPVSPRPGEFDPAMRTTSKIWHEKLGVRLRLMVHHRPSTPTFHGGLLLWLRACTDIYNTKLVLLDRS